MSLTLDSLRVDIGGGRKLECDIIRVSSSNRGEGDGLSSSTSASSTPRTAALVFHPWQWLGGCMEDPMVHALWRQAAGSGMFDLVVRYNNRGTGGSSGMKSLSYSSDAQDALGLCKFIHDYLIEEGGVAAAAAKDSPSGEGGDRTQQQGRREAPSTRIVLLAYSYGSCIAAGLMELLAKEKEGYPRVAAMVSVGFPLGLLSRSFLWSHSAWQSWMRYGPSSHLPALLLMGTRDQFTDISTARELFQAQVEKEAREATMPGAGQAVSDDDPPPFISYLDLKVLEGRDHFHWDKWDDVVRRAMEWLHRKLEPLKP